MRRAYNAGVNVFFFYGPSHLEAFAELPSLVDEAGDDIVVATGSGSRSGAGLDRARRNLARQLGTETIDLFFAEYVSPADQPEQVFGPGGALDVLCEWRDDGRIRYVGASTHDADLALALVTDGRIDVLMLRYNMAHRRVGGKVFPAAHRAGLPVVAFTATRWGTLLEGHPAWSGPPPTASACYRYCLAAPAVEIVLSAPTSATEIEANLRALDAGALSPAEASQWDAYGDLVHGDGHSRFEIQWP